MNNGPGCLYRTTATARPTGTTRRACAAARIRCPEGPRALAGRIANILLARMSPPDEDAGRRPAGHWAEIARRWAEVGPPLRPSAEDLAFYRRAGRLTRERGAPRVLLLGVTPELYRLPWPDGTDLLARSHRPR